VATGEVILWIPAYNEARSIEDVVSGLLKFGVVVIFDDCSSDCTASKALESGAIVISSRENCGYEIAISAARKYATDHGFDILITVDADGQHSAESVGTVLGSLMRDRTISVVIGARKNFRRVAEKLFSICSFLSIGVKDPMSGLKAYRVSALQSVKSEMGALLTSKILIELIGSGSNIEEIEIDVLPRKYGASRFGASLTGEWKVLKALFFFLTIYFGSKRDNPIKRRV